MYFTLTRAWPPPPTLSHRAWLLLSRSPDPARAGGMENSSAASASSEAGSSRSQEIEELERFIDSYVLEYQVQGLLADKTEGDGESEKTQSHISQVSIAPGRSRRAGAGAGTGPGKTQRV